MKPTSAYVYDPLDSKTDENDRPPPSPDLSTTDSSTLNGDGKHKDYTKEWDLPVYPIKRSSKSWWWVGVLAATIVAGACLAASTAAMRIVMTQQSRAVTAGRRYTPRCGPTAASARAAGCHFDVMMTSWIPGPCFDADLMREFADAGFHTANWTFLRGDMDAPFYDQPAVAQEEVMRGEWDLLWVDGHYHHAHCAYGWAKQWRALSTGGPLFALDSRYRMQDHVKHCINVVMFPNATYLEMTTPTRLTQNWGRMDCIIGPI